MSDPRNINRAIRLVAEQSIDKASQVLSKMLRAGAKIELKRIEMVDIGQATEEVNRESQEVIGAFVDLVGDAPLKFLFYVESKGAFILTDLLLRKEIGTTKQFDMYVSSAIQEIGNILASAVANVFAADFQLNLKPSPPVVFNDFAGTLFEQLIMEIALQENKVILMESLFEVIKINLKCRMFILPQPGSEKILEFAVQSK